MTNAPSLLRERRKAALLKSLSTGTSPIRLHGAGQAVLAGQRQSRYRIHPLMPRRDSRFIGLRRQ